VLYQASWPCENYWQLILPACFEGHERNCHGPALLMTNDE